MPTICTDRTLPHNLEAERALLGSILLDNSAADLALESLTSGDFYSQRHRLTFDRMLGLLSENRTVDLVTLSEGLDSLGQLEKAGGAAYIASLTDGVPIGTMSAVGEYVRIVRDKAITRRVINTSQRIMARCFEGIESSTDLLNYAVGEIVNLDGAAGEPGRVHSYREAAASLIVKLQTGTLRRVLTGITDLDKITGGFQGGELVIYTAETGVGKTLLAQQTRRRACRDDRHGLFASGEMSAEQLLARELAAQAGVDHWKMRQPERLTATDAEALLERSAEQCPSCKILDGEITMPRVAAAARRMRSDDRLDLVVIDYDELVVSPGRDENERQAAVARAAKSLAVNLDIPVILISQLNKADAKQEAQRAGPPSLRRLYGSGAKAKHASMVIYVNREYVQKLSGCETAAEIYLLKSRDGRVGRMASYFNLKTLTFESAAEVQ
jgi:replicative DNA helicase